jgi:hypothetical protein
VKPSIKIFRISNFGFRIFKSAIRNPQSAIVCLLLLTMSSCFKEKPLPSPSGQSIGQTKVIEMKEGYHDQFFYSLETNTVISQNSRFIYDLMFECDANKYTVWLNTSKFMSLVRTDKTSLSDVTMNDTIGHDFRFELGEFNVDSNSFEPWWDSLNPLPVSKGKVYIINLGKDFSGTPIGYMKMRLNNFSAGSYSITYSSFGSPNSTTVSITKDATRNYAYFSFASNSVLSNIEPDKSLWDLCFTRYTVIFYEPTFVLPYEVTGVLHNPSKVSAYLDSTVVFDSIRIADFNFSRLLSRRDAIGYTWKLINDPQNLATYSIKYHYTYFIKTAEDKFYKLRFFDFYRNGEKGYPAFEYYQL